MKEVYTSLERKEDAEALSNSAADAVLVALDGLSSSEACKLSADDFKAIKAVLEKNGKKVFVRANLTLHENVIERASQLMDFLAEEKVHAIFFSDPAIYYMAKKLGIEKCLIYEPETLMTSINDARWWIDKGVKAVSVSPLLTLEETAEILHAVKESIVTVHGRTLMSRSYRKLLSAYKEAFAVGEELEGRKDLSLVESKRAEKMPVYEDETGTLIYSDDVLDSFDFIETILKEEPMGLLIEGAFLSLEEQIEAVAAYRKILEKADPVEIGKEYRERFSDEPLDSGYYGQKTVR